MLTEMSDMLAHDREFNTVRLLSDSQAALMALDRVETESQLVLGTKSAINRLGEKLKVELGWIKAHVNHKGNEMADKLAKTGTSLAPQDTLGPSRAVINSQITNYMYTIWNERWKTTPGHRQSKYFMPDVFQRGRAKLARNLSRQDTGILVRNITGHAFLRRHNSIIQNGYTTTPSTEIDDEFMNHISGNEPQTICPGPWDEVDLDSPSYETACRKCRSHNSVETPYHLATGCEATWRERLTHFGTYALGDTGVQRWKPLQVVGFFKALNLED